MDGKMGKHATSMAADNDVGSPLIAHLIGLRTCLLKCATTVLITFLILFYFASDLFELVAIPLLTVLPEHQSIIATAVTSSFLAPLKLSFVSSFVISIPVLAYFLWGFFAPALYKNEQHMVWPLIAVSTGLFYLGMAFAYFLVLPLAFGFFTRVAPPGLVITPDIRLYLDFCLKLFLSFGLSFEVPVVIFFLAHSGIMDVKSLAAKRPYVILAAFVVGMLLTPPDVVSQILLAIPIWLLYEVGLLFARLKGRAN